MTAIAEAMDMAQRNDVMRQLLDHKRKVALLLLERAQCLMERAVLHDDSKFNDMEFEAFVHATPKLKNAPYGSDEYKAALDEIRPAIDEHNRLNRHHPEHHLNGIHDMTLCDLTEMLCDWKAATERTKDGNMESSIRKNASRFGYGDEIINLLMVTARSWGML